MPFRIRSVLAAHDLSDTAAETLRSAGALAALADAELHVVHAMDGEEGDADEAGRRLEDCVHAAVPGTVSIASAGVTRGRPDEVILRRAQEVGADLLVIGPHREGRARQRLGTTADRLVRASDVPCLIVHGPVSLPLRRVLVPSDLSDAARGALELALIWAAALRMPSGADGRTRVEVLHVHPPPGRGPGAPDAAAGALRQQVSAAGEESGCASLLQVEQAVAPAPDAADEIIRRAGDEPADLLVLGTRGQGRASSGPLGSVSSDVARRAPCPVLLVPPAFWRTRLAREAAMGAGA